MASDANLVLSDDFVEELLKSKVYDRMKNMFHIATAVTPLVAISHKKWTTMTISRDQLASVRFFNASFAIYSHVCRQVSVACGNQRPALLAAAEREIWKCLLRINLGSHAIDELSSFLRRYEELELDHSGQDLELDWFAPSRKFLICLLLSIATNNL
jgi:hypothetical protein